MKWFVFLYPSCFHCKHFIPFPQDKFYDLGKCTIHSTYAEKSRKDETKCGLKANNFTKIENPHVQW